MAQSNLRINSELLKQEYLLRRQYEDGAITKDEYDRRLKAIRIDFGILPPEKPKETETEEIETEEKEESQVLEFGNIKDNFMRVQLTLDSAGRMRLNGHYNSTKYLKKIFGRVAHSKGYDLIYPLLPTCIKFWKSFAIENSDGKFHSENIEYDTITNEFDLKTLCKGKIERYAGRFSRDLQDSLYGYNFDHQTIEGLGQKASELLLGILDGQKATKDEQVGRKVKKGLNAKIFSFSLPSMEYGKEKDEEVVIEVVVTHDETIRILDILQPMFENTRENILKIKKWRTLGLDEEEKESYDVQGEFDPFEHQWVMWKVHTLFDKSLDLSEMGTGKTYGMLMAIDSYMKQDRVKNTLVICPNTVAPNWVKECKKHTPHLTIKHLMGSLNEKADYMLKDDKPNIVVVNYESFQRGVHYDTVIDEDGKEKAIKIPFGAFATQANFDMVVLDEIHKVKNPAAKRTQQIAKAFEDVPIKKGMSGTINANKLQDVFMPMWIINRARDISNIQYHKLADGSHQAITPETAYSHFLKTYFWGSGYNISPAGGTIDELREIFEERGVRYKKDECFDLPEKDYQTREIKMDPKQESLYRLLEETCVAELLSISDEGGKVTINHILAMYMKLGQAANGFIKTNDGIEHNFKENPKLDTLVGVLDDIGVAANITASNDPDFVNDSPKVVVWSKFKRDFHNVVDKLREIYGHDVVKGMHGDKCAHCGSPAAFERVNVSEEFNDPKNPLRILVANTSVGGHGIDLVGASYEIYYGNSFVKTDRAQSEDRCHRPGMQNSLTIIDLIMIGNDGKPTVDGVILDALRGWKAMSVALLAHLGIDTKLLENGQEKKEETPVIKDPERKKKKKKKKVIPEDKKAKDFSDKDKQKALVQDQLKE
ncbi:MAG: SNF2-related protein, partial [Candidatus Sifarchaeia archaeon]